MTSVRFLYTSQPGKGFEEFTSPEQQLKNWLRDNLRVPSSPSSRSLNKGLGITLQDDLVICTYLSSELDDNKRRFTRSHSALLTEGEYNRLAKDFRRSILAELEKTDEEVLEAGQLKPLGNPGEPRNGLTEKELEVFVSYRGWDLKQVLASLIAGRPFTITLKGTQDESISLAVTLLEIAAHGGLPVPQISTFEPNGKARAWYPSQVSSQSQARVDVQFHPKGAPGREAADQAERLARAIENLDPDGISAAMASGRNHEEVKSKASRDKVKASAARENKKPEVSSSRNRKNGIYEDNKDFEAKLDSWKGELDDRENGLDRREQELAVRERNAAQRERDVADAEVHLNGRKRQLKQWAHIFEIISVLDKDDSLKVEERVVDRFFNEVKNLRPDTLRTLETGVRQFIPGLERIAARHKASEKRLQGDIKDIRRKLE